MAALRALGVRVGGRELRGIRYTDGRHSAEAAFRDGPGAGVRRTEPLHTALRERAAALGVRVVDAKVHGVRQDEHAVTAAGLTARWLIAADGLHSPLRRALGLDRPTVRAGTLRTAPALPVAPWTDHVEVRWSPHGEAYMTPVGDRLVGVAVLSRDRRPYDGHLAAFPALAARLADVPGATTVRGAGPLRQSAHDRRAGRVLLVGDAAGYVDALTGEGIALAVASRDGRGRLPGRRTSPRNTPAGGRGSPGATGGSPRPSSAQQRFRRRASGGDDRGRRVRRTRRPGRRGERAAAVLARRRRHLPVLHRPGRQRVGGSGVPAAQPAPLHRVLAALAARNADGPGDTVG
ncbi:hypothetical protein SCALM49S_02307 [Streptomyces californicus]